MNNTLFVANDSIPELFALRRTLFDDPTTAAAIVRGVDHGIERSRGLELSID